MRKNLAESVVDGIVTKPSPLGKVAPNGDG